MTKSSDETRNAHAPGSQPSVRPGSDEPQTITAPTPPVAWSSGPPEPADLADSEDESERTGDETKPASRGE
jgi:hypothetical protein